jgi:hypothetical protein
VELHVVCCVLIYLYEKEEEGEGEVRSFLGVRSLSL